MMYGLDLDGIKACLLASLYTFSLLIPDRKTQIAVTIFFLLAALLLQSRTLFCIVVSFFLFLEPDIIKKINNKFVILLGTIVLFVVVLINVNSVIGRLFIWKNILNNIHKVPLSGFGADTFKFQYAKWQAEYFVTNEKWSKYHFVADAPSFAFNEVLHFYVEYGIVTIILFTCLIYFNIRIIVQKVNPFLQALALSNLCIFSFAFVSYSLHSILVLFILIMNHIMMVSISCKKTFHGFVISILLLAFILICFHRDYQAKDTWLYAQSLPVNAKPDKQKLFDSAYITLHKNQYFLFNYCSFLLNEQNPDKVLSIGITNRIYFNQYEYNLLMGNAYLIKNKIDSAKAYFAYGHYIIPNRLIPLSHLLSIAQAYKDTIQIHYYAEMILATPIKIASPIATEIKREAQIVKNENSN